MITLAHITQTSGRTIATALLAGGLVAGTATGNPAAAGDSFGLFGGSTNLFGGQNSNNWNSNNNWNNNANNGGWNANAWSLGPSLALGALALSSRNDGNDSRSSSYAQGYQAGQNNAYHANPYNRYSDRNSHWWPRLRNENVIVVGRVRIPFDPDQAQRPPSADFQIGQVSAPPAGLQSPAGSEVWVDDPVQETKIWDDAATQSAVGANWGIRRTGMFIPRIGSEVIVEFSQSDPDRPLITGRVYNAESNFEPYQPE